MKLNKEQYLLLRLALQYEIPEGEYIEVETPLLEVKRTSMNLDNIVNLIDSNGGI